MTIASGPSASGSIRYRAGHGVALAASVLLLADTVLLVIIGSNFLSGWMHGATSASIVKDTPLPIGLYAAWALGVFGSMAAIIAITLYGFRERWFWRCLIVAAVAWLVFPPIHAIIGLISLVLLVRFRSAFPRRTFASAPPP